MIFGYSPTLFWHGLYSLLYATTNTYYRIFDPDKASNMSQRNKHRGGPIPSLETKTIYRDTPQRSLIKALTYRITATSVMFIVFVIILRTSTQRDIYESMSTAGLISVVDFVLKLAIYYFHERIWSGIIWGKYWRRHYWVRRAWRKAYRNAHKKKPDIRS